MRATLALNGLMLHKLAMLHIEHSLDIHTVKNLFLSENIPEKYKKVFIIFSYIRVLIIASCFANYEVNSSNCDCKVVNHTKNTKQFFPKENLIHLDHTLPHYIHILFIHYMLFIISRNIAYTQHYIEKCKKWFAILKTKLSPVAG